MNMTTGSPALLLIKFALPMLIGGIFQQVYNLADSVIVGRMIGSQALASIGATSSVTFLFFALCNGISSGGGIITSQSFGQGSDTAVKKSIANTAYVMLTLPTIVGITAFILSRPLLTLLGTPDEIMADALGYTRIMCVGIVFVSGYNYAASMLRSLGDSRTPLYFLIFSCCVNAGMDVLFVGPMRMGVLGAGLATIISQLLSAIACLAFALRTNPYFKMSREELKIDFNVIGRIVKLGVPLSLQFSLIAISCMALQRVVNSFGATAVAAFTATSRIEQMIHQPYQTMSMSLSTFCGQNYGAKKNKRVIEGYHKSLVMMAAFTLVMVPVIRHFGDNIMSIFVKDSEEVIAMGGQALRISALFYIFLGTIYIVRGVLNGLGDASFALLNGIVEVIGRFTVPIWLTSIASVGVWGIWWSVGVVWFISGFTAWLRYLAYKKKTGLARVE